jgi:hypothetical protein
MNLLHPVKQIGSCLDLQECSPQSSKILTSEFV